MIEGIKKFGRALTRDHLPMIPRMPVLGGLVGGLITGLFRGLTIAGGVSSLVTSAFVATLLWGMKFSRIRKMKETQLDVHLTPAGFAIERLQGPGMKMHTIMSTQKLITRLTKKYEHEPQLPAKIQKKIDAHVADAQEAATQVQRLIGDEEQREFPLLRQAFNAAGQWQDVPVATLAMRHTPTPDEIDAQEKAANAAKMAEGAQAASAIHAGSTTKLTIKPIKLKQPKHKQGAR